jgi:hypothetical protein
MAIQIVGIMIALAVAIAVGRDAKSRGMDALPWGIFVFLILIVGLPVYFIVRKPKLPKTPPPPSPPGSAPPTGGTA